MTPFWQRCFCSLKIFLDDPDLPARTIVAVTAIVFLDQFGDELPQDVIDALEVCRR